jgi:hypothetical protein
MAITVCGAGHASVSFRAGDGRLTMPNEQDGKKSSNEASDSLSVRYALENPEELLLAVFVLMMYCVKLHNEVLRLEADHDDKRQGYSG